MKQKTLFDETIDLQLWLDVYRAIAALHDDDSELQCLLAIDVIEEQIAQDVKTMRFGDLYELLNQREQAVMEILVAKFPPDRN